MFWASTPTTANTRTSSFRSDKCVAPVNKLHSVALCIARTRALWAKRYGEFETECFVCCSFHPQPVRFSLPLFCSFKFASKISFANTKLLWIYLFSVSMFCRNYRNDWRSSPSNWSKNRSWSCIFFVSNLEKKCFIVIMAFTAKVPREETVQVAHKHIADRRTRQHRKINCCLCVEILCKRIAFPIENCVIQK